MPDDYAPSMRPLDVIRMRPRTAAALFALIVSLLAAIPITRTIIHPDEVGYILNANRLLGGGPSRLPYFPGYSGFIVPVLAITRDPDWIIRGIQLVNGLLAAGTAAMSVAILQRLRPDARPEWHVLAACAVSLYPAFRLFGSLALSENALIPASLVLLLLTLRASDNPSVQRVLLTNAAAGASLLIHQRAVGIAAGTAVAMLITAKATRDRLLGLAVVTMTGSVALVSARLILAADSRFSVGQSDKTSFGGLIASTLEPRSLITLPLASIGQLFYLSVATLGVASLGVLGITRIVRTWSTQSLGSRTVALWLAPCAVFTLVVSSMFMNQGTGDKAIYGRYVEAVLLPILLVGFATLTTALTALERRIAIAFPSVAAVALIALRGTDAFEGRQQLLNVAGIVPIIDLADRIDPAAMAIAGTVAATVVLMMRRRELGVVALVGVTFLAVSITVQLRFGDVAETLDANQASDLTDAVSAFEDQLPDGSCVLLDETDLVDSWTQQNFRLANMSLYFLPFQEELPTPSCATSVLTNRRDFALIRPGSLLLAVDPTSRHSVWILPTDQQMGFFSPDRPGVSDPGAWVTGDDPAQLQLSVVDDETDSDDSDDGDSEDTDVITVEVQVTNQSFTPFLPPFGSSEAAGTVAIGVEWRDPLDPETRIAEPYRIQLDGILYPGETVTLTAEIPLEVDDPTLALPGGASGGLRRPLPSGTWMLRVELVQEGIRWIDRSSDVLAIQISSES